MSDQSELRLLRLVKNLQTRVAALEQRLPPQ
jgi:hypothetical protein